MVDQTHFDRTFRYTDDYQRADEDFARKSIGRGDDVGECLIKFLTQRVYNKSRPKDTRKATAQMNRTHWLVHCAFREHMRTLPKFWHYVDLIPMLDEFQQTMRAIGAGQTASGGGTQEDLNTTTQMHYQQASFILAGKKVYEVALGLALELIDTELRGIKTDELRLPFESVYIHLPKGAGMQIPNADTGYHGMEGIYITEDREENGNRMWRFLLCGEPKPLVVDGVEWDNDALLHWKMELPDGITLDEAVNRCEVEMEQQTESEGFKAFIPDFRETFRFTMNTILYATMPDADVQTLITDPDARKLFARIKKMPKGKKRAKLSERLKTMNTDTRIVLGREVTIDRTALDARKPGNAGAKGRKMHVQFRRCGHWRNQRYGSMSVPLEDRPYNRIRIKPTWVNKGAPLSITTYKLELPDD